MPKRMHAIDEIAIDYEDEKSGWIYLVTAIIEQAKKDYRDFPDMRDGIERFYRSGYFTLLTGIEGEKALYKLQQLIK